VLVATNEHPFGSNGIDYQEFYFAEAGTLTLTETTEGLAGSLSNVSLTHVVHERGRLPTDEIADSCTTTVPDLAFDISL